jgi:hypothetical protein
VVVVAVADVMATVSHQIQTDMLVAVVVDMVLHIALDTVLVVQHLILVAVAVAVLILCIGQAAAVPQEL